MKGPAKIFTAILFLAITSSPAKGEEHKAAPENFSFLPHAVLEINPALHLCSTERSSIVKRNLLIEVLRYREFSASFRVGEEILYESRKSPMDLQSIWYDMDYINLCRHGNYFTAGIFSDHRCLNFVNREADDTATVRWYGYGMYLKTPGSGIRTGRRGILESKISAARSIHSENYPGNARAGLELSYRYMYRPFLFPFMKGEAELFLPLSHGRSWSAETGLSYRTGSTSVSPFLKYERRTGKADRGLKREYASAGVKFTAILGEKQKGPDESSIKGSELPGISLGLKGDYSRHIRDRARNFRTSVLTRADFPDTGRFSLFGSVNLKHSSPVENSGLYPRYIDYFHETGISVHAGGVLLFETLYRYMEKSAGNTVDPDSYREHLAGARIMCRAMKPGARCTAGRASSAFRLLADPGFSITVLGAPSGNTGLAEFRLFMDLFTWKNTVTHWEVEVCRAPDGSRSMAAEAGTGLAGRIMPSLFIRHERTVHRNSSFTLPGSTTAAGLRAEF